MCIFCAYSVIIFVYISYQDMSVLCVYVVIICCVHCNKRITKAPFSAMMKVRTLLGGLLPALLRANTRMW